MRMLHACLEMNCTLKVYTQTNPGILLYLPTEVQRTQRKLPQEGKGQLRVIVIGFLYIVRM